MKFSAAKLHDAAITLENEVKFHERYHRFAPDYDASNRRDLILDHLRKCKIEGSDMEDREHLRRYFDDIYDIPPTDTNILNLPRLEFWRDEVKYPPDLPPQLREGTKFDVSFAKLPGANDRERWSRYGFIWNTNEVARLKGLFWSGRNLEYICRSLERPPNGVISKLTEHHCLAFDGVKLSYLVRKKTPTNSNTSDAGLTPDPDPVNRDAEPIASPAEIAEHIDEAVSHLTRVSNSLKEILMNKTEIIKIETKTFVNGVDIATLDDASVYALIATQEAQIKELDKIETKPKKLTAEIEKRKAGVQALVDYLDSKSE